MLASISNVSKVTILIPYMSAELTIVVVVFVVPFFGSSEMFATPLKDCLPNAVLARFPTTPTITNFTFVVVVCFYIFCVCYQSRR